MRLHSRVMWSQSAPGPGLSTVKEVRFGELVYLRQGVAGVHPDADPGTIVVMHESRINAAKPSPPAASPRVVSKNEKKELKRELRKYARNG